MNNYKQLVILALLGAITYTSEVVQASNIASIAESSNQEKLFLQINE